MSASSDPSGNDRLHGHPALAMRSLILSRHEFRSANKANIHFIAAELARRGPTSFVSVGFSPLSRIAGDPRWPMRAVANQPAMRDGVDCVLWRTPFHPIALPRRVPAAVERATIAAYLRLLPGWLAQRIDAADVLVVESGLAAVFGRTLRRRNRRARLIYNASDDLATVGAARGVIEVFRRDHRCFDVIRAPSALLVPLLPPSDRIIVVPHGVEPSLLADDRPSPYGAGRHAVSLGSMLFDRSFFELASTAAPEITFHVIGAGPAASGLAATNIRIYPTMPHGDTIPFIRHADVGIAPYLDAGRPAYLMDSSMKLRQFAAFGLPSLCPRFATGTTGGRIAYEPGDQTSIRAALDQALALGRVTPVGSSSWTTVVDALLANDADGERAPDAG